jgi:CheY-like chemotaxis protein
VSREADDGVIRVQDNGIGIDASQLPKIFDLFSQVDGSMGRSYGGLGIGLALARNLVEMQSGRIVAKSQGLGRGSEFTVKLPSVAEDSDPPVTAVVKPPKVGRSLRVLVVEDNVDAADSLSMLLRLYGHEVRVARTGPTALELASAFLPNVVLLDIGLPGMDGYEVARRLRECPDFQDVKICAVTGYTPSEADRGRQQEVGFDHYFVKPLTIPKLMELFQTVTPLPEAL